MNKDKFFIFAAVMIIIILVAVVGAGARSRANIGKESSAGDVQTTSTSGGSSSSVVLAGTNGRPIPVSQQGVSNVTGSVAISNTTTDPVPVSVQGQVLGIVGITNNSDNPVPVSVQNTSTVALDSTASGHLSNIDSSLNKLSFDSSGSLKTTSGGGAGSSVASKGFTFFDGLKGNQDNTYEVTINGITTTINVSLMTVKAPEVVEIEFFGPNMEFDVSGSQRGTNQVFTFPERVPINRFHVTCVGLNGCIFKINMVGD